MVVSRRDFLQMGSAVLSGTSAHGLLAGMAEIRTLLILGGTGFIGPHLTAEALRLGWSVTHFNRGKSAREVDPRVEALLGDREGNLDVLQGRKWDAVVDNSGYVPKFVKVSADLLAPNVGYCLYTSSVCVYKTFAGENNEDSPKAAPVNPDLERLEPGTYGPMKVLCERYSTEAFKNRIGIIRPGYIAGPGGGGDHIAHWPVRASKGGEMLAPGSPRDPIQIIDVRDLATWMMKMVEARTHGVFNVVSPPRAFTMGDIISVSKKASSNPNTQVTWVPADFLIENLRPKEQFLPPWLPPSGNTTAAALVSAARAIEKGLVSRPLWDTVADTLRWFQSLSAEEQAHAAQFGLNEAREREILAAWHRTKNGMVRSPSSTDRKQGCFTLCD